MEVPAAVRVLVERVSCALLREPAPSGEQLALIQRAALRAADHRYLRPWRFLMVEGEGLERLGELFANAKRHDNPEMSADEEARTRGLPARAPLVIVAIVSCVDDPKVPAQEQLLSTGAAVQNMLNACHALGFGAIWRTGDLAYHKLVHAGLGLAANESVVGFVYVGTPAVVPRKAPELTTADFFRPWP